MSIVTTIEECPRNRLIALYVALSATERSDWNFSLGRDENVLVRGVSITYDRIEHGLQCGGCSRSELVAARPPTGLHPFLNLTISAVEDSILSEGTKEPVGVTFVERPIGVTDQRLMWMSHGERVPRREPRQS